MNLEQLFVETLIDMNTRLATNPSEYSLLRVSGLLRQILLNKKNLLDPASAAASLDVKFRVIKPGPPPILTKRGADILVQVEKLLDDAARTAGDPVKPVKPVSSNSAAFPDSFAAATTSGNAAPAAPRKN